MTGRGRKNRPREIEREMEREGSMPPPQLSAEVEGVEESGGRKEGERREEVEKARAEKEREGRGIPTIVSKERRERSESRRGKGNTQENAHGRESQENHRRDPPRSAGQWRGTPTLTQEVSELKKRI